MSLNAEPSQPNERAAHDLPPKSYATAAHEAIEPESHAKQTNGTAERVAKNVKNIKTNGQIKTASSEDQDQYEGTGEHHSPKSPTRSHRRRASLKSNGSIGRKHGQSAVQEVYEKHTDANGHALTSVKPAANYDKETRTDKKPIRRNSELKSGRQAGAGWHTSKYVQTHQRRSDVRVL